MDKMAQTVQKQALMQTYSRTPVKFVKGKGSYVWDENGEKYLDFTSGIAVCNLGHVPEKVKNKVAGQLDRIWHTSNLFEIGPQEELAEKLAALSAFDQAFFANSGAEANEAAIKLARLDAKKRGKSGPIVTFKHSFHGRTLGTLSATAQEKIQHGFEPLVPGFIYLPFNDIAALRDLAKIKPIAVMFELIQGKAASFLQNRNGWMPLSARAGRTIVQSLWMKCRRAWAGPVHCLPMNSTASNRIS